MEAVEEKMIKRHYPRLMGHDRLFLFEDVLINVLSKLPVKTLLRFRFPAEYAIDDVASMATQCQVFTLGMKKGNSSSCLASSCWRGLANSPYEVDDVNPAFVDGAIHWLVDYDSTIDTEVYHGNMIDPHNTIIAFDVESEEFRLVPHPEGCPDRRYLQMNEFQLVELRGLLCLSCVEGSKLDMWMLKGCESGNHIGRWMKEYSIDLNVLEGSYLSVSPFNHYAPRDRDDTKPLIETYMIGLGYYDLQSTGFKGFIHRSQMPKPQFSFYVESLRSLEQPQVLR